MFFVFKLVFVLLLVVQRSKAYLPMPPSWLEVRVQFLIRAFSQLVDICLLSASSHGLSSEFMKMESELSGVSPYKGTNAIGS